MQRERVPLNADSAWRVRLNSLSELQTGLSFVLGFLFEGWESRSLSQRSEESLAGAMT